MTKFSNESRKNDRPSDVRQPLPESVLSLKTADVDTCRSLLCVALLTNSFGPVYQKSEEQEVDCWASAISASKCHIFSHILIFSLRPVQVYSLADDANATSGRQGPSK